MIMTAHVSFSAIDPASPATMSARLIRGALREELGFGGVVVSDDVGMRAVSNPYERPEATVATLRAGCDMLSIASYLTSTDRALTLASHISEGARRGQLSDALLHTAARRRSGSGVGVSSR